MTSSKTFKNRLVLGPIIAVSLPCAILCIGCSSHSLCRTNSLTPLPQPHWSPAVLPDGVGRVALVSDDPAFASGRFFEVPLWALQTHTFSSGRVKLSELISSLKSLVPKPPVFDLSHNGTPLGEGDIEATVRINAGMPITVLEMGVLIARESADVLGSEPSSRFSSPPPQTGRWESGTRESDSDVSTVCFALFSDGMRFHTILLPRMPHNSEYDSLPDATLPDTPIPQPSGLAVCSNAIGPCWIMQHRQLMRDDFESMVPSLADWGSTKLAFGEQRMVHLNEIAERLAPELENLYGKQMKVSVDLGDTVTFPWPGVSTAKDALFRLAFYSRFTAVSHSGWIYFGGSKTGVVTFGPEQVMVFTYPFGQRGLLLHDWH